ncbi:MAG: integrase [Pseudomonadota bacterium]
MTEKTTAASRRSALSTGIRLAIISLIVGAVLTIFRIDPVGLWRGAWRWLNQGVVELFGSGIEGLTLIATLIATGAIIVIPIWLVRMLLRGQK